jgi:hypothetical protein
MKMSAIKGKAKELGISPGKMGKENLIRRIQVQEGNVACFRARKECGQNECCWREDCLAG